MKDDAGRLGPIGPNDLGVDVFAGLIDLARRSVLSLRDIEAVQRHLSSCEIELTGIAALTGEILRHKLRHARRMPSTAPAAGVAMGNSVLSYRIRGQQLRGGRLSHRAWFRADPMIVPVRSLLGATLIGVRLGDTVPLLLSDGSFSEVTLVEVRAPLCERSRAGRAEVSVGHGGPGGLLPT
ncbi:hypothetical protein [Pseudodonghicola flavimaris]|uniref:Transcription elongation factor GreA/GreB C-terminal domain-containing protein n=1 Tax=Pseudodonghicola flavimaris TaxID=3050036 RepID=A0ABT7F4X5_9RHOB|nr:hypothetical protein [Pseudodonghicola flavimaris]MDK3019663.1 hypothetical protein [Pseudodonghicola flavimaris]